MIAKLLLAFVGLRPAVDAGARAPSLSLHLHKPCMHPHPLQSPRPVFLTL